LRHGMRASNSVLHWTALVYLLTSFAARGQQGFVDVPLASVVPGDGDQVMWLHIRPLINTTENPKVKGYIGSPQTLLSFGDGWPANEGTSAAQSSANNSPTDYMLGLSASLIHIGSNNSTASKLPLNGELRGKYGVKAVTKAAPSPDLVCHQAVELVGSANFSWKACPAR
jgi:hypothetical protein